MGARLRLGKAVACAAVLCWAARSGASTVVEPIARLSLEGGYDSNALYNGSGADTTFRASPDLGLRLRDPLWDFRGTYGGDFLRYEKFAPNGIWNHRGELRLRGTPTERTRVEAYFRGSYAFDPVGLAQFGIFGTGRQSALMLDGQARAEWRAERRIDAAATLTERSIIFENHSGGAMYAGTAEALWRESRRLSIGGALAGGIYQTLDPGAHATATSEGVRGRLRYRMTRRFALEAWAGPALWQGDTTAIIPEAAVELLGTSPHWDLRLTASHALGIGYTARPGLVDTFEFGAERRIDRRYFLRANGGLWRSGLIPTGADAVTGFVIVTEAGTIVRENVRISIVATHISRVDPPPPPPLRFQDFVRTTVGLRVGWELPVR